MVSYVNITVINQILGKLDMGVSALATWLEFSPRSCSFSGTAVAQWLRCCATIRKVAGSIPTGVSGFFFDIKCF